MFFLTNEGNGKWLLWDRLCGEGMYLTKTDLEEIKDLITAALQDNDITESQYLKNKGEVQ